MLTDKSVSRFIAKDGHQVILRTLQRADLDDCIELINSLVEEGADIVKNKKVTLEEEAEWLNGALSQMEQGEKIYVVAETDGKVIGNSEIGRRLYGYDSHVGVMGIAIKKGFRDVGIGTEMMKALITQGQKMGLRILMLSAFESNKRAIHVYEKLGFKKRGQIPKKFFKRGKYVDEVIMSRSLT